MSSGIKKSLYIVLANHRVPIAEIDQRAGVGLLKEQIAGQGATAPVHCAKAAKQHLHCPWKCTCMSGNLGQGRVAPEALPLPHLTHSADTDDQNFFGAEMDRRGNRRQLAH